MDHNGEPGSASRHRILEALGVLDEVFSWPLAGCAPELAALEATVVDDDRAAFSALVASVTGACPVRGTFRVRSSAHGVRAVALTLIVTPASGGNRLEGALVDVGEPDVYHDELTTMLAEMNQISAQLELQNLELEALRHEAEERSRTDALTGAYNRRHLVETLAYEQGRASRGAPIASLLLLDIDRFKSVNDTYGHPAGDAVLIEVATRLRAAVREHDTVARFGGEEFAVLLVGVTDEPTLATRAEVVRGAISARDIAVPGGVALRVTASCGAVVWGGGRAGEEALELADQALYAAKRGGRDQVRLYATLQEQDLAEVEPESLKLARGLALAASVREASPVDHCEEVADVAAATAHHLGLSPAMILRCRLGGLLHDIGKLAIPDRIVHAQGVLGDDDRRLLRGHVELGADIVGRLAALHDVVAAVRHHHELHDGSGYPDGLAGEAIPVEARIVAAADAYSAIRAGRPYQASLDVPASHAALRAAAPDRLDPRVVEAVVAVTSAADRELVG